ncbi:heme o synthase [Cytophagaceae bacterium ABcell3]|nr:heme o synthase [Cytophagaceae bacterium ABcell3]
MNADKLNIPVNLSISAKIKAYFDLVKFRLSFLVAFTGGMGYLLGTDLLVWSTFIAFLLGGFLMTGAANTINQIIEKDLDKLMVRTSNRPLPTGRLSVSEAIGFCVTSGSLGFALLYSFTGLLPALLTLISLILYGFVYTPLKRKSSVAVLVGAFPGALPPLIGWAAATGGISIEGLLLFGIQFMWQFPHFWAIAWVLDEEYKKAGFKLLPSGGGKDLNTAIQIMIYTLMLIPLGLIPAKLGITGINSAIIATVCGVVFLMQTFSLMKSGTNKAALKIMFGSFLYLPIVQIAFVLDKIIK